MKISLYVVSYYKIQKPQFNIGAFRYLHKGIYKPKNCLILKFFGRKGEGLGGGNLAFVHKSVVSLSQQKHPLYLPKLFCNKALN